MKYEAPQSIDLTDSEAELYSRITETPREGWDDIAEAMEALVSSLRDRNAVPEVRLRLFSDPDHAETGSRSPQQIFESNGTSGNDISRHPHFVPYLRHYVRGPDLPRPAIDGLCKILNDDRGTSGMIMDQHRAYARSCVRTYGLDPSKAATEFFRLGVEIGMKIDDAQTLRRVVRSTR